MKRPKHFFNLEWKRNKDNTSLIYFNLSYGFKVFNPKSKRAKYIPLRISTEYTIEEKYWIGKPNYRANRTYIRKFGKTLNNVLDKIEKAAYDQLLIFRNQHEKNPTPTELKRLVLEKLNRIDKISTDVIISEYIQNLVEERTNLPATSKKYWSTDTGKQYTNLNNYIKKYENKKGIVLTFKNITSEIYWDYFKTVNDLKKAETGNYFIQSTIANQCKNLMSIFNKAKKDGIEIDFKYFQDDFKIEPSKPSYETYLPEKSLKIVINKDVQGLFKKYEHARNFIIISSLTGLRIGDMMGLHEIEPEKVTVNSKNYYCFNTKIRKSRENREELTVTLPVLAPLRELLKANNGKFPKFPSQQKTRAYIKDFLKFLEFNDSVQKTYYYYLVGSVTKNMKQSELFSPHDCRRTFITNLKQLGIQNETLENLTHPKLKYKSILDHYDKSTLNDNAVKLIKALNRKNSEIYKY